MIDETPTESPTFESLSLENTILWERLDKANKEYNNLLRIMDNIHKVVSDVYYAAYWIPDRDVAEGLWIKLRDVMGFDTNKLYKELGEQRPMQRVHVAALEGQPILDIRNVLLSILLNPDKAEIIARTILSKDVKIKDLLSSLDIHP